MPPKRDRSREQEEEERERRWRRAGFALLLLVTFAMSAAALGVALAGFIGNRNDALPQIRSLQLGFGSGNTTLDNRVDYLENQDENNAILIMALQDSVTCLSQTLAEQIGNVVYMEAGIPVGTHPVGTIPLIQTLNVGGAPLASNQFTIPTNGFYDVSLLGGTGFLVPGGGPTINVLRNGGTITSGGFNSNFARMYTSRQLNLNAGDTIRVATSFKPWVVFGGFGTNRLSILRIKDQI